MSNPTQLYYLMVPTKRRPVDLFVEFLSVTDFTDDEPACRTVWDMMDKHFHTRGKFLAIWPSVRHVVIHRRDGEVAGCLFVSTPLNWQIDYVMVRPDMRHQGISTALVNAVINEALARKVPYVMLTSKPELRPLYEGTCGFRVVGQSSSDIPAAPSFPLFPALGEKTAVGGSII